MANISKNIRAAKKTLENVTTIQDLVNENVLIAVRAYEKILKDPEASDASVLTAAREFMKLHWLFLQASEQLLKDEAPPQNREEERKQQVGNGVLAIFNRNPNVV